MALKVARINSEKHRRFVASLMCLIPGCYARPCQCAHVRYASAIHGKRETGAGRKPGDNWTVPLCVDHHAEQHTRGEYFFWVDQRIDALVVAALLWAATGDEEAALRIVSDARCFKVVTF